MSASKLNEEKWLQSLAERARDESGPVVDVADSVMQTVAIEQPMLAARSDKPLMIFTAVTVIAASIALMIGWQSWSAISNPAFEVVQSFDSVMP